MPAWVLLTYRVPREPSAARVFVWRRLQRLGAIRLHDAAWVLPRTPFTLEQAQWLATEIQGLHGDAIVWLAEPFPHAADAGLVRAFTDRADRAFAGIALRAARPRRNPTALAREFRAACARDYFQSTGRERARAALLAPPTPPPPRARPARRCPPA